MLKDMGRTKKEKTIKCDKCKNKFDSHNCDMIKRNNKKFLICPFCDTEIKVK